MARRAEISLAKRRKKKGNRNRDRGLQASNRPHNRNGPNRPDSYYVKPVESFNLLDSLIITMAKTKKNHHQQQANAQGGNNQNKRSKTGTAAGNTTIAADGNGSGWEDPEQE